MGNKQDKTAFKQLMKSLSEQEQVCLFLITQGARLLAQKKKQRITRRF